MQHRYVSLVVRLREGCAAAVSVTVRGLRWSRCCRPAERSGVAARQSPARASAVRDRESIRRASLLPGGDRSAWSSSSLPPSVGGRAGAGGLGGRTPKRLSGRTMPPGWEVVPVEMPPPGPTVKTSNPRLTPRDAQCAVGGIRAWAQNSGRRASHLPTVLLSPAVVCGIPNNSSRWR